MEARGQQIIPYQELLGNYDDGPLVWFPAFIIPYQEQLGNYDCAWGEVSALIFLQLQCSGAENCPITIGAYGEGGAPIDNDGQGIWYQDYGCAPDSTTHV